MSSGFVQKISYIKPASVKDVHIHAYGQAEGFVATPSTNAGIHPAAKHPAFATASGRTVHDLTFTQRELIYHETRGCNSSGEAIALYKYFFDLCSMGQLFSIPLKDKEPFLIHSFPRSIVEVNMWGPKLLAIARGVPQDDTSNSTMMGVYDDFTNEVLVLPYSEDQHLVLSMTSLQFGERGRGSCGEPYFLGTTDAWVDMMGQVCDRMEIPSSEGICIDAHKHTARLQACAKRVWERWQNRENEGWCDYCGVGSAECKLQECSACKEVKVRYCCAEHQKAAWKLHKFICEKNKKVG